MPMKKSPLFRKVTKIFKHSNLRFSFPSLNTLFNLLRLRLSLKCNICDELYVDQTGGRSNYGS